MDSIHEQGDSYVRQVDGYLVVEAGLPPTTDALESVYRAFAVTCVRNNLSGALVKIGDDDSAGERALRDAFTMMILAGIGIGFRLALVAVTPGIHARYFAAQRDLSAAGVEARLFGSEHAAVQWLSGAAAGAHATG